MISLTDKNIVTSVLSGVIGQYNTLAKNELQFYCPFCNHHKPKLQINTETQKWHCWVCNSGGSKITSLLRKLDVDRKTIAKIRSIYGDSVYVSKDDDAVVFVSLPKEFKLLSNEPKGFNPEYRNAIHYLKQRNISMKEIVKYGIGYCEQGLYARRIIIPSFDCDGKLNYFVSRSYYADNKMKYKNPPISKNVVCFDSQINWTEPIILCEGVFDAIAIRRNAIPLLGKFPSKNLIEKIFLNGVKDITISLDNDAFREALKSADYFRKQGIRVRLMRITDKDASEMGYEQFYAELKHTPEFGVENLLITKIMNL